MGQNFLDRQNIYILIHTCGKQQQQQQQQQQQHQQQKQQQQFSPVNKQLVESMADVRPSEYLGFHSV